MRCPCSKQTIWLIVLVAGTITFILGFVFAYAAFPAIISSITAKELDVWEDGTEGQKNFYSPPVPLYIKFFLYNVTNPDEVQSSNGTVKPSLNEQGPYYYLQDRIKANISTEEENKYRIRYGQQKTYYFNEEMSCSGCTEDDIVNTINSPLIGLIRILNDLDIPGPIKTILFDIVNVLLNGDTNLLIQDVIDKLWEEIGLPEVFKPELSGCDGSFFKDELYFRGWSVHQILFGGVQTGGVHIIKLVEGVLALLELQAGRITEEQYLAGEFFIDIVCDPELYPNVPAWAYGECDHSRAPWDETEEDTLRRETFQRRKKVREESTGLVIPWVIGECGFSGLTGKNGTTFQEWYEANTGKDDMNEYLEIEKWGLEEGELYDDITGANWWTPFNGYHNGNQANMLRGTDGQQFHPDFEKDDIIWVFQTDICRTIFGEFVEEVDVLGINGYRFVIPAEAFKLATKLNVAYCREFEHDVDWENCMREDPADPDLLILDDCNIPEKACPDGVLEITRCMQGAPVTVSSPRFYQSPDYLREYFDNAELPVSSEHETSITVEPVSGVSIVVEKRLQLNINLKKDKRIDIMSGLNDEFYTYKLLHPFFWLEEGATLDEENADLLHSMVELPVKLSVGAQWTMVALGAVAALLAGFCLLKMFYLERNHHEKLDDNSEKDKDSMIKL